MFKNVIFDLGGVLVNFNPHNFLLERFCNASIEKQVYDITFGSEEWKQLDAGNLTRLQGNALMMEKARTAGCAFEVQCVLDDWMRALRTKTHTVAIMRRLHKMGFRLFYLSNIAEDTFKEIQQRDFFSLFEGGIASYEVHINKPDPIIYEALMRYYQLSYSETLFIDDAKENVATAYELGLTGIHYQGIPSLIKSLNACGIPLKERALW